MADLPSSSERILSKLAEQLTCPICLEYYKDPKVLNCHHVFCFVCLEKLADRKTRNLASTEKDNSSSTLTCPTCRQESQVPLRGGMKSYQSAFHIHSLFDIQNHILSEQNVTEETQTHVSFTSSPTPTQRKLVLCSTHRDRSLEMYCETCFVPICCACVVQDHKTHTFKLISDVFPKQKEMVSLHWKLLEQQVQVMTNILEKSELEQKKVKEENTSVSELLELNFQQLHKILDNRKTELSKELNMLSQEKLKLIAAKTDTLRLVESDFKDYLDSVCRILETGNEIDILSTKKPLLERLEQASLEMSQISSTPSFKPDLNFFVDEQHIQNLFTVGKMYTQIPCAQSCLVRGLGSASIEVGERVSRSFLLKDQHGIKNRHSSADIQGKIYSNNSAGTERCLPQQPLGECVVSKTSSGNVIIDSQTISSRGRNRLQITVNGEDVPGSPFDVIVRPHPTMYSHPVHCMTGINGAWGVAVDSNTGSIIATENKEDHLLYFSQEDRRLVRTVGRKSLHTNQFQQPAAIYIDNKNRHLYITELFTFTIKKCKLDGDVIMSVGSPGQDPMEFMSPMGISVNPLNGKVYVADMENHRIQVLNSDLKFDSVFTGSSDGDGVRLPSDVAFDRKGNMYVTNNEKHCVQVFAPDNHHLVRIIGRRGK